MLGFVTTNQFLPTPNIPLRDDFCKDRLSLESKSSSAYSYKGNMSVPTYNDDYGGIFDCILKAYAACFS